MKSESRIRKEISQLGLEGALYDTHSLRIGQATDLLKANVPIDEIKRKGRWKSNAVFKYLRE